MCLVPGNKIDGSVTLSSGESGIGERKHSADTPTLSSGPGAALRFIPAPGFNFLKVKSFQILARSDPPSCRRAPLLIPAFFLGRWELVDRRYLFWGEVHCEAELRIHPHIPMIKTK